MKTISVAEAESSQTTSNVITQTRASPTEQRTSVKESTPVVLSPSTPTLLSSTVISSMTEAPLLSDCTDESTQQCVEMFAEDLRFVMVNPRVHFPKFCR